MERTKGQVADQMLDIPVLPVKEEIVAVLQEEEKLVPQDRVQQPTVEHAPVPQLLEETVELALSPTERVQRRTVDVPMSQVLGDTIVVVRLVLRERV